MVTFCHGLPCHESLRRPQSIMPVLKSCEANKICTGATALQADETPQRVDLWTFLLCSVEALGGGICLYLENNKWVWFQLTLVKGRRCGQTSSPRTESPAEQLLQQFSLAEGGCLSEVGMGCSTTGYGTLLGCQWDREHHQL